MIELVTFYKQTAYKNEYYIHKFEALLRVDMVSSFWICDEEEAISEFKKLVMPYNPENPMFDIPNNQKFIYLCNFLYNNGYYIEQFPKFLERPTERWEFSYDMIRESIMKENGDRGKVSWADRRIFVNSLNFIKNEKLKVSEDIKDILKTISTRSANFLDMETDEKLETLCNSIEHLLKPNKKSDKFLELDYSDCCGYLNNETVKKYRNELECFRHSTKEDLQKRKEYTNEQKDFLISYGLLIVDFLYSKVNDEYQK